MASERKERPIIFTGWKAAWVASLKPGDVFQTRRPAKLTAGAHVKEVGGHRRWHPGDPEAVQACPYGAPGTILWAREKWCPWVDLDRYAPEERCPELVVYGEDLLPSGDRWRPSIHMPRWASRSSAEIVDVRVQRLQDITEDDAKAEGVTPVRYDPEGDCWTARPENQKYRSAFEWAWNEIYGWTVPPAWEKNGWVWALTLRKL